MLVIASFFITYILDHLLEVIYLAGFVFIDNGDTLKCCTQVVLIVLGHVPSLTNGLRGHQIFLTHIWESMCWVYYKSLIMHQFLLTILGRFFPFAQNCSS